MVKLTPNPPFNLEEHLMRISDLLRCASATFHKACDELIGQSRDFTSTVIYLLDMAQALV